MRFKTLFAVCALFGSLFQSSPSLSETLRTAWLGEHEAFLTWYAKEKGWDKEAGLDIIMLRFDSGKSLIENVRAYDWAIAGCGAVPAMQATMSDQVEVIAIANDESSANMILTRPDSPILAEKGFNPDFPNVFGTPESVKGKLILCPQKTSARYLLDKWLAALGLEEKDVKIEELEPTPALGAFKNGYGDILADYFQQNYNITINVVNKPGGAQAIGINEMLRARPDGYTLAFPGFSALATTPKLTNVGYTLKNIKPVAHIASMECVLSTNKSSGIDTWEKFLQAAEKNPDGTVYGTTGSISTQRLYMTKLTDRFHGDLKIRHTAYTSGHEVSTALLGKHITAGFQVPANILPYANSGDFNVIAISRKERRADLPNTPTFRELYADKMTPADEKWIDLGAWHGLVVSSKVKDDRIAALEPLIEKAMKDPEVIEKVNKIGLDAGFLPAKEFGQLIQSSSDLADEVLAGRKSLD